ncbi:glycosyltransferase [Magnetofaba australis]|uniref:Putative glycosyltransferase 1 protein n=1 Tax=Magnetofaba australis IT-1 TaxID=1434232 RepID=A0A1Y2K7Z1_9PROT|nr:glycosyltransferase [Magnetofaba australis]OSM06861.1 putative glycosyltransferase 1 protein [Magnetofaba australis IT-1]
MRIVTFSTLFPNPAMPRHGLFVARRLAHLTAHQPLQSRVVAPVPWFPSKNPRFGDYARFAAAPRQSTWGNLTAEHPRYALIPKLGMSSAPLTLALGALPTLRRLRAQGYDFDLIDAHYAYPDGVAAALLGMWLDRPVTVTARGSDINLIPQYAMPRRWLRGMMGRADGLIGVCQALTDAMIELGAPPDRCMTLRNGVDLDLFRPATDRGALRRELGYAEPTLLSVGHLIERKGHDRVISALAELPEWRLRIIGEGPLLADLQQHARACGVGDRVTFDGALPPDQLARRYAAADALMLASSREGWANVLLEALACGTPVAATPIWGTPEVVAEPIAGELSADRSPPALAAALRALHAAPRDRAAVRRYAERFSWDATSQGQFDLFTRILATREQARSSAQRGA